jgi:hypothetical protein
MLKKYTSRRTTYLSVCTLFLFNAAAGAQDILYQPEPDSPIGTRNPAAPEGTSQYDFLIGDWEVDVTLRRNGQSPLEYRAKWHNHWIADGYMVMQEWRGPYSTGVELRSYDPAEDLWHGRNIYVPSPGTWYENTARLTGSDMIVTTVRTTADGEESITREIYFDISNAGFRIRSEVSLDGGVTWSAGRYSAIARLPGPGE